MTDTPFGDGQFADRSTEESVLSRDRIIVMTVLIAVGVLAWGYTLAGGGMRWLSIELTVRSSQLDAGGTILEPKAWSASHAAAMFIMWWVMTVAMMIPSASPAVLTFAATTRKLRNRANAYVPTGLFLAGYLAIWGVFGWAATIFQWGLEQSGLMSAAMFTPDSKLAGALFIGAGLYQLSGFKQRCLRHCQDPQTYFDGNWRQGSFGALSLGMAHGGFCLGCSWFLMALLFVGGILNVFWITGLAVYVFLEKYLRHGSLLSIVAGCVLTCWGMLVMVTTW